MEHRKVCVPSNRRVYMVLGISYMYMARIITVPFRNEDEILWSFIEKIDGKPVSGPKIRSMLYDFKKSFESDIGVNIDDSLITR